jgi:hypothetical protein
MVITVMMITLFCSTSLLSREMCLCFVMQAALPVLAKYGLLAHGEVQLPVEDASLLENGIDNLPLETRRKYSTYLLSRPPSW